MINRIQNTFCTHTSIFTLLHQSLLVQAAQWPSFITCVRPKNEYTLISTHSLAFINLNTQIPRQV